MTDNRTVTPFDFGAVPIEEADAIPNARDHNTKAIEAMWAHCVDQLADAGKLPPSPAR